MMTVEMLSEQLGLKLLAGKEGLKRECSGCYIGDLLSWVMGRARSGEIWLTVMGNVNAIAVATLADTACIVLTDSAPLDEPARRKAEEQGVAVLQTEQTSYQTACRIAKLL